MGKFSTLLMMALLLCFTLTYAARPNPNFSEHGGGVGPHHGEEQEYESCGGIGEEECLKRRTLDAHIDYIYDKKQNVKP
ncbi:hypothetical protein FH972_004383 [Carpinus fangiana]|uniref:Phytosulfokine n=1 Tax=Carpinus fangiana TaxID=176857 RepID=A0A5N6QNF9_9ROSI|nr:hypothetical protein FH972_004383 [Carpinus fangiana]